MDGHEVGHILPELDVLQRAVDELALPFVGGCAVPALGGGRDEPIPGLFVVPRGDNAVVVGKAETAVHPNAVAPGIEARVVPAHLRDHLRGFRVVVKVGFEFYHVVLIARPNEIAQSFEFLAELADGNQLLHIEVE